ncbi:MAG: L,D-transpeptidase [Nitrospira sp.]|nr:L,D-transpeptidase [Nitrospira sp.]
MFVHQPSQGFLRVGVIFCILLMGLSACVQKAPPELLQAVEVLDHQLVEAQGVEFAPEEYARFVEQWVAVKGRMLAEEDVIHWPWEANPLAADLRKVQEQGERAASAAAQRKEAERRAAEARLAALEERLRLFTSSVDDMGSRVVLGQRPIETELLVKQARSHLEQGRYSRSTQTSQQASHLMDDQIELLSAQLGHYADERRVRAWRQMVRRTVNWSRTHRTAAIVVSKADRLLTLYRNGRAVVSYPVELGYNGILEKRYQGDGATPEGYYRVIRKRDRGQTKFYRALLLDYPNSEDRRRFRKARVAGVIPVSALVGGEIEIHGGDDRAVSQTLGCIMLENRQIDALFEATDEGTPVTIVGAVNATNSVAMALAELARTEEG